MKLHPLSEFEYHFLAGGLGWLAAIMLFATGNPGIALIFASLGTVYIRLGQKKRSSGKK